MKNWNSTAIILVTLLTSVFAFSVAYAVPSTMNHQGYIEVDGLPLTAPGSFKFGFYDASNNWVWTNDGTHLGESIGSSTPDAAVSISIVEGIYSVELGDTSITNMTAIGSSVFSSDDVKLRILFDDGTNGEQTLLPDQPVGSVAYAHRASVADSSPSDTALYSYRSNAMVLSGTSATLNVLPGELAVPNSGGSDVRYRRNTGTTPVTWADLDTGAEASSTQYYVYALADAAGSNFTVVISASNTAPSGASYYRQIGYFYNDSSGDIRYVGNTKGGDVSNIIQVIGTDDVQVTTDPFVDMPDMEIRFVSSGRPVRVHYNGSIRYVSGQAPGERITIDGVSKSVSNIYNTGSAQQGKETVMEYIEALAPGVHTIKVQWGRFDTPGTTTVAQMGSNDDRTLIVEEL